MKTLLSLIAALIASIFLSSASARTFQLTVYSDGRSCPHNCDAHVVFHASVNGTSNAFSPTSSRSHPKKCETDELCRICFSDEDISCITVMYRHSGPAEGRFDFTPAFYEEACAKEGQPKELVAQCDSLGKTYRKLTEGKVYCLAEPDRAGCKEIIEAAEAKQSKDQPLWDECRALGENKFNVKYAGTPEKQRSEDCAYEKHGTGGPNSKGEYWKKLLPAACWPKTYVGRDGTDCCDANKMSLGGLGVECSPFLVKE
jgi:hypothetical protein